MGLDYRVENTSQSVLLRHTVNLFCLCPQPLCVAFHDDSDTLIYWQEHLQKQQIFKQTLEHILRKANVELIVTRMAPET